jgi:hypothetical protein
VSPGSSVGIVTRLRTLIPTHTVGFPGRARKSSLLQCVQMGPVAQSAYNLVGIVSKLWRREAEYSPVFMVGVKNEWSPTSTLPLAFGACTKRTLTLPTVARVVMRL